MIYHEARLVELLERLRKGFADFDAGTLDAFELDEIVHAYMLAARELWKFCAVGGSQVGQRLGMLELWRERGEEPDWWEAGRKRR